MASGDTGDTRFEAALRMDVLINTYEEVGYEHLRGLGYDVDSNLSTEKTYKEVRRFLETWIQRCAQNTWRSLSHPIPIFLMTVFSDGYLTLYTTDLP